MKKTSMKKVIISGALALSCLLTATTGTLASEKVSEKIAVWDGAEVVKHQTGKMTFTKDVKVYKKDKEGNFVSLVVPKGNFFRVYDIEKYNGESYYNMSSGYRVKATKMVVFKEVPLEIRRSFYENPVSINISRNPVIVNYNNADANTFDVPRTEYLKYGEIISTKGTTWFDIPQGSGDSAEAYEIVDTTNIKLVEASELKLK